ncbi:MAG: sulfatase-like hydrolase/transferase [Bacteroidota bacterium]
MRSIPGYLAFLFFIFLSGILLFGLIRIALLLMCMDHLSPATSQYIWYAVLNRGLLFDIVTTSYLIALPFVLFSVTRLFNYKKKWLDTMMLLIIQLSLGLALMLAMADIPYFLYYNARINQGIFTWTDNPSGMAMAVIKDYHYYPFLLAFPVFMSLIVWLFVSLSKKWLTRYEKPMSFSRRLMFFFGSLLVLMLGLRGELNPANRPLRIEYAFKTPDPFANQLGLNPVFHFIQSQEKFNFREMPEPEAIRNVQNYLGVTKKFDSPLAREITSNSGEATHNIVLIFVESLSASKIGRFNPGFTGNTPFLDSLALHCRMFDSVYSAGEHTYNGVFSSLYGLPTLIDNKVTSGSLTSSLSYAGLPQILKSRGYQNVFFCPNDREFDNFEGFLIPNGFSKIYDDKSFPKSTIVNGWGVSDHYLFNYALGQIDSLCSKKKPFFAALLTISTHSPYIIPSNIPMRFKSEQAVDRSYEYTDWALKGFFKAAASKPWFQNTIFVIIGDHGQNFDKTYEMPLSYHHTPLYIYCPWDSVPKVYGKLGMQIDITPTILDILGFSYINNTLGIDLFRESRPFAYFNGDTRLGCIDHEYFYIRSKDGRESLFQYKTGNQQNYATSNKEKAAAMKKYMFSNMQVTQYMIKHSLTGIPH